MLLLLSYMSFLYILETKPWWLSHLQKFSPILWVVFSFLFFSFFMVSLAVQKVLILIRSHWFICVFIVFNLGGGWNKMLLWLMSKGILSMFSSRSFIVSGLTFRSLIYFEFVFVYGVRKCSNFILLHVIVQVSQHHLLKRLFFLHCMFLAPLS